VGMGLKASSVKILEEMNTYSNVRLDSKAALVKGGYVLIIGLNTRRTIHVGSLGGISFPEGFYAYLGSALGSFKSRLNRHLTRDKKPKWHIDYLLSEATVSQLFLCDTERRLECILSQALVGAFSFIPGFGSSDCRCQSHLYFADDGLELELGIKKAISEVSFPRESFMKLAESQERSGFGHFNYRRR